MELLRIWEFRTAAVNHFQFMFEAFSALCLAFRSETNKCVVEAQAADVHVSQHVGACWSVDKCIRCMCYDADQSNGLGTTAERLNAQGAHTQQECRGQLEVVMLSHLVSFIHACGVCKLS